MPVEVIYRPAAPLDSPMAHYPGFAPGTVTLPKGSVHAKGGLELPCDILLERDVAVKLRDGTTIYIDIYRPPDAKGVPGIVAWSPYGKRGGFWSLDLVPDRAGVPPNAVSGLQKFEGPDPAFWCGHGYAVINPDIRGVFKSEGDIQYRGKTESKDGYDLIEWVAARDWCNGKVGMSGNSWLAIEQWFIAAERPPHLAAIAPWEGYVDSYRDFVLCGGIPSVNDPFLAAVFINLFGQNRVEDVLKMVERYPLMNEYWEEKIAQVERIQIPVYVAASWVNKLHVRGTLDGFRHIHSKDKWLRVHNSWEWPDLYANQGDLLRFFDHYLKEKDNGWESTPRVRLSVLDPGGVDVVNLPVADWPLPGVEYESLYLDASAGTLTRKKVEKAATARYKAEDGQASFLFVFENETDLIGPMSLHLWVEAVGSDDMDLYSYVQKLDDKGVPLTKSYVGGTMVWSGPRGQLRVSHRRLDPLRSTPAEPYHTHRVEERLTAGEIVPIDIPIWPVGMRWHGGQRLRLIVTGMELAHEAPPKSERNHGEHVIHAGGHYDSFLLVPVGP